MNLSRINIYSGILELSNLGCIILRFLKHDNSNSKKNIRESFFKCKILNHVISLQKILNFPTHLRLSVIFLIILLYTILLFTYIKKLRPIERDTQMFTPKFKLIQNVICISIYLTPKTKIFRSIFTWMNKLTRVYGGRGRLISTLVSNSFFNEQIMVSFLCHSFKIAQ